MITIKKEFMLSGSSASDIDVTNYTICDCAVSEREAILYGKLTCTHENYEDTWAITLAEKEHSVDELRELMCAIYCFINRKASGGFCNTDPLEEMESSVAEHYL